MSDTWKCDVCGYVHRGSSPPARCPVCGVGSELFSAFEIAAEAPPAKPAQRFRCTVCEYVHDGDAPPESCPVCGVDSSLFEPLEAAAAPPVSAPTSEGAPKRIVVLGAGVAGLTAAEEARRRAPNAVVVLVSKEPELPYYRLNLTRLLAGEIDEAALPMQPASFFADQRIELRYDAATAIDRASRRVQLESGTALEFDCLVLATGGHPFVPPLLGATRAGVWAVRSKADVDAVRAHARRSRHAVVIGGGLLGLEAAGALRGHGLDVTVVEGFEWLLPRQLALPAGRLLQRWVEDKGIAVRCGARTEELVGDEEVRGVKLAGGEELPAELVILAAGVRPNSYLARLAGLTVNRAVVVDDQMRTSDPSVFAAGDVAEHRGAVPGLWPHGYAQGLVAGANAAGANVSYRPLPPSNQLKVLGVDLFSIGEYQPRDGSYSVVERDTGTSYVRLVVHDGQLVGANLLGETRLAGPVKGWVEAGTQIAELPELRAKFPELEKLDRATS